MPVVCLLLFILVIQQLSNICLTPQLTCHLLPSLPSLMTQNDAKWSHYKQVQIQQKALPAYSTWLRKNQRGLGFPSLKGPLHSWRKCWTTTRMPIFNIDFWNGTHQPKSGSIVSSLILTHQCINLPNWRLWPLMSCLILRERRKIFCIPLKDTKRHSQKSPRCNLMSPPSTKSPTPSTTCCSTASGPGKDTGSANSNTRNGVMEISWSAGSNPFADCH